MDRLARAAAVEGGPVVHDKIPSEVIVTRAKENGLKLWQRAVDEYGERAVTKSFFPLVRDGLRQEVLVSPEFTSMVTGHGKLRSYYHRLGITDNPTCLCAEAEDQTTDHLIFRCKKLSNQKNEMIRK